MATPSLDFCDRAVAGKTRFAQTVPRLFSARLRKFKAPSRQDVKGKRRKTKANPSRGWPCRLGGRPDVLVFLFLTFLPYAAPWIFVARRKKRGGCLSAASLPPLPPRDKNPRRVSPHRARLSLLTFFGKTKKVSQPRQGMKQGMHHQQKNQTQPKNSM